MRVLRGVGAAVILVGATTVYAGDEAEFVLEAKTGSFAPSASDWSAYFEEDSLPYVEFGAAYKVYSQVSVAMHIGRYSASGRSGTTGAPNSVPFDFEVMPVHALIVWRGAFSDEQRFVPYFGGGVSRVIYTESTRNQPTVSGSAHGIHARAGLQVRVDAFRSDNVRHDHLFVEYQVTRATKDGADLGGTALLGGVLVEF